MHRPFCLLQVSGHHSDHDPRGGRRPGHDPENLSLIYKILSLYSEQEAGTMSIFEKTRHCTKRFPCRFKLALMIFSVAVIASIITVPLIHNMA
jgi:hypothetical protein